MPLFENMHTVSLNPIQYSNKNNPAELSFKGTFALPSGVTFDEDKKSIFNFSKRYEEIKKYNPKKDSIKKLKHLNDEDFQKVIGAINKVPKRKMKIILLKVFIVKQLTMQKIAKQQNQEKFQLKIMI